MAELACKQWATRRWWRGVQTKIDANCQVSDGRNDDQMCLNHTMTDDVHSGRFSAAVVSCLLRGVDISQEHTERCRS